MQNLSDRHVARWINARENAGSSPKTIANWHGLLFQVLQRAVNDGLRAKYPCTVTGRSLPARDAHRTEEDKVFLTEAEFALVAAAMWPDLPDPLRGGAVTAVGSRSDRDLLIVAVRTGVRWGELTPLTVADCQLTLSEPRIHVHWAWKKNGTGAFARTGEGRYYLGHRRPAPGDARSAWHAGGRVARLRDHRAGTLGPALHRHPWQGAGPAALLRVPLAARRRPRAMQRPEQDATLPRPAPHLRRVAHLGRSAAPETSAAWATSRSRPRWTSTAGCWSWPGTSPMPPSTPRCSRPPR